MNRLSPGTLLAVLGDDPRGDIISAERNEPPAQLPDDALDQLADVPTDDEVHGVDLDGVGWRLDVPDDAVDSAYEVPSDELRLHQVVSNLLTNARKHTPAGTTVTVTVRRDGFAVHDDGPGFPPELAEHAFERFALVDAIVSARGGTVTLDTRPGDTTIDVRLPL